MATIFKDLVEQTTSVTGSTDYLLSGTVPYRRTFADAFADAQLVIAMIVGSDGAFEHGIYEWDEPTTTLLRTGATILNSSNAGAAVSWAAGNKQVYCASGAATSGLVAIKHTLTGGAAAPTASDDEDDGYGEGSLWLWGDELHYNIYAGAASAQWCRVVAYELDTGDLALANVRCGWKDSRSNNELFYSGATYSGVYDATTVPGEFFYGDGGSGCLGAVTTNATPKKLGPNGDYTTNLGVYIESLGAHSVTGKVIGMDKTTGDVVEYNVDAMMRCNGAGTVSIVRGSGALTPAYDDGTLNAAVTACSVVSPQANFWTIEVTGVAATTIVWSAYLHVTALSTY